MLNFWLSQCLPRSQFSSPLHNSAMFDLKPGAGVESPTIVPFPCSPPPLLNYTQLQNLLATGRWQDADEETRLLILQAGELPNDADITEQTFLKFPLPVLSVLDQLWRQHSGDRFGFSVQSQIWRQIGGWDPDANYDTWLHFGKRVGWLQGCWLSPHALTFNLHAPVGHLPALWTEEFELGEIAVSLFARIGALSI
jgi:eukaryotic-like serine/threonine-protein kinase